MLGGLLFISLSQGGNSKTLCATASCPVTSEVTNLTVSDASITLTEAAEPAEEQKVPLTTRLLHMVDTFAKLVMVI